MSKFYIYPRIRKKSENPKQFLRLHRAEFAHDFNKNKYDKNNYYPSSEFLIKLIAKFYNQKKENIIIGLGGESLIKDTILWHQQKYRNKNSLNTYPNFFMYEIFLKLFHYKKFYFKIDPFNPLKTDANLLKNNIKKNKISLLVLVNPAHPFEKYWKLKELEEILKYAKQKKTFVIVDEVYQGIGTTSCIKLTKKFKNLIVIKSASKTFGYPGLRLGYAIGNKAVIKEIESYRLSHELPTNTIEQGINLFKNYKTKIIPRIKKIIEAREYAINEFKKRNKIINGKYGNSLSIFFESKKTLLKLGNYLKKKKIIVNYNYPKPYEKFLNITTTSKKNLKFFFNKFDQIIND
jgi:histidinol-phosphate/aromatic aminotransferase/cobyric acid decarboxylase-like protein